MQEVRGSSPRLGGLPVSQLQSTSKAPPKVTGEDVAPLSPVPKLWETTFEKMPKVSKSRKGGQPKGGQVQHAIVVLATFMFLLLLDIGCTYASSSW